MTWWVRDDRWLDEEPALVPLIPPLPAMHPDDLVPPTDAAATSSEPWRPSGDVTAEPIAIFAAEVLGLPLWPAQAALLSEVYAENIRTAVWRLGRRSGKGRMASVVATYEATVGAAAHLVTVPAGEEVSIVIVANSREQARLTHRMIAGYFERPALRHYLAAESADALELTNGIVIRTLPCSARSARGLAAAIVIFDEAAWYIDSDGSPMSGEGLWDALVPATAQFPSGKVLVLSTPRWSVGWYADLARQAASGQFGDMRHWWATTRTMNPTLSDAYLEGERAKDPATFAREYEARFDSGIGAVFDEATVRSAVEPYDSRPPVVGATYTVAIDAAYTGDTFALVIGRREGERVLVERVSGWRGRKGAPLEHRAVLDEVAQLATIYNRASVLLDQYAAEPIAQGLAERGVSPIRKPWRNELKVDAVTVLRQLFYAGNISLPRHPSLIAELVQLEQRPLPSGRARIAAPSGAHDDYATALLALAHQLTSGSYTGSLVGSN